MTTRLQLQFLKPKICKRLGEALLALAAAFSVLLQMNVARAGNDIDLAVYNGNVVLLDFWVSWCGPCRRSFPWMNDMHTKYSDDGLVIVAVNVDNDLAAAQRFLTDYPAKFSVHFDEDKTLAHEYEVVAMPSTFLIGRDGRVVEQHLGFKVLKQDEYEAAIRAELEKER